MNPWVYTLPRGESSDEVDVDSLEYEYMDDFIEENNHPGRMEDGQVLSMNVLKLDFDWDELVIWTRLSPYLEMVCLIYY